MSNDSALEIDKKRLDFATGQSLILCVKTVDGVCVYLSVLYVRGALRLQPFCQGTTAVTAGSFAA